MKVKNLQLQTKHEWFSNFSPGIVMIWFIHRRLFVKLAIWFINIAIYSTFLYKLARLFSDI